MKRTAYRLIIGAGLVALGWVAGHSQTSQPDFEIVVNSPKGETTVECVKGCALAWVERGDPTTKTPTPTFYCTCGSADPDKRCSSQRIGGWIRK